MSNGGPRLGVVGLVAGREIRQRVRGRAFRVATALLLAGVAAAIIIPAATKGGRHTEVVAVVGADTPALRQAIATAGRSTGDKVRIVTPAGEPAADRGLRAGDVDVAIIAGDRITVHKDAARTGALPRVLAQLLGLARAVQSADLTQAQANALGHAAAVPVTSLDPPRTNGARRSTAAVSLVVMFVLLTQYLGWTLIGVMEEKASRVVEVLLATVRPLQLLVGKVLGIAAAVFAQAAVVAAVALVLAKAAGSDLLSGKAPLVLLSALAWLVLGYALYCWFYAAAGSMVERQDQVQSLALPLSLPLIASYIMGISLVGADSAPTWFHVLAYFPPTAPFAMTTLVGLGAVTWWEFVLSAALSVVATVFAARLAAVAYRRAILRTGRRVSLRELVGREAL